MTNEADRLRKMWRAHHETCQAISAAWRAKGMRYPPPRYPALPDALRGLACGAKTRAGSPCKLTSIYMNGRCKLHGGLSTGPTSDVGKAVAAINGKAPKRKRTP